MSVKWTAELVKRELPEVSVNGEYGWRVSGRENKFASVYHPVTGVVYEFAWDTIVNVLNKQGSLRS